MPVPHIRSLDTAKLAPMVMPSGMLCSAMAQAMTTPATNSDSLESLWRLCMFRWSACTSSSMSSWVSGWCASAVCDTSLRVLRSMRWFSRYTTATPSATARITSKTPCSVTWLAASSASARRSKHTMAVMTPPAKAKSRLIVRFDSLLNSAPMRPPSPVPPAPEMSVTNVTNANGDSVSIANRLP